MINFIKVLLIGVTVISGLIWGSSIDQSITDGEYDGFIIGSSKQSVFEALLRSKAEIRYDKRLVLFNEELKALKAPVILEKEIQQQDFYLLSDKSEWNLFFNSNYFYDSIRFEFCEERLCKIWRYRFYLELI